MTPEGIVVAAVEQYFSQPKFQKFSIKKEDRIQFGSRSGFGDVALIDSKGNRAAIVECKRDGVEGHGIEQLKSYLCATDTPFGIFANSDKHNDWKFYENLGQNRFKEISRFELERRIVNPIVKVLNFLRRSFRRLSKGKSGTEPVVPPVSDPPDTPDPDNPNKELIPPPEPPIHHIGRYKPLENEYRENTVDTNLNGKLYYSEDNGFSCAAALRGMPEALPEHIGIIIRNEQLEIEASREQLQSEIDQLDDDKNKLKKQKQDYEQQIETLTQDLADKRTERTELKTELEAPTNAELNRLPEVVHSAELEAPTNVELNQLSEVVHLPENSARIHIKEKIKELEQEIREKTQEHAEKRKELVGLKVKLEAPTNAELDLVVFQL